MTAPSHAPGEIDKAIELLIALKSARPAAFAEAMEKVRAAPGPGDGQEPLHASSLALGLLRGPFSEPSAAMLLELAPKLPKLPSGAPGLRAQPGAPAQSLAARALRMNKLGSPWALFVLRSMRDGLLPADIECAYEMASRLQLAVGEGEGSFDWLGSADEFHEALASFFELGFDWPALAGQTGMDFLPWILAHWLPESSSPSLGSALRSARRLLAAGAASGLRHDAWLAFASPAHPEHAQESLAAMAECLRACPRQGSPGPALAFCMSARPSPWMGQALRMALAEDPRGAAELDELGRSCAYFLNERVAQSDAEQWQRPLLDCFQELLRAGVDPRSIAPQLDVASMARHPLIAAAVEAASIGEQAGADRGDGSGSGSERRSL